MINEITCCGQSLPMAYHYALYDLWVYGAEVPCPDYNTTMKECSATIVVDDPLQEPMISKCGIFDTESLQQYKMEIEDGILDFMIGACENSWEYTYHDRIVHQIPFVIRELRRNPHSRRAVIDVRENITDMFTSHPACMQNIQFTIRDNKLNMYVLMRSNDAVNATFMNMFAFIMLQKKIADELGVDVGNYVHRVNSFHVYEKDFDRLESYAKRIEEHFDGIEPEYQHLLAHDELCYKYYDANGWKPMMEKEIPKIMAKVKAQKEKYNITEEK